MTVLADLPPMPDALAPAYAALGKAARRRPPDDLARRFAAVVANRVAGPLTEAPGRGEPARRAVQGCALRGRGR